MPKHHGSSHRSIHGKNFIILPILYSVLILGLSALIIIPNVKRYYNMVSLFISDNEADFSVGYNSIYVPVSDGLEEENSPEQPKKETKKTVPLSEIMMPHYGEQFGELIIDDCQVKANLFWGDGDVQLNNGVGVFNGSFIPGYGKTIMVAGHNVTYFNGLKYAEKGQKVLIRTSYGNYTYEITDVQVKDREDSSAYNLRAEKENLIMYTCYPFDEIGLTPNRCFVYAKFVSGPVIDKKS